MNRNLQALAERTFDVLIVGGGIYGVCAAWDAALRGLSVALVEQGDFGQATSAHHHKVVHGGIRYLQHLDVARVRGSSRERSALLRIAPHLVQPVPIMMPTYRGLARGKSLLRAGFLVYDGLTCDRNRGIRDVDRRIARGRFLSRADVLVYFPHLAADDLTGAAIFEDGQIYNPPRLTLAFVQSAAARGAHVANYVRALGIAAEEGHTVGIDAEDVLTGRRFRVRSRTVLNAAGPWALGLAGTTQRTGSTPAFSRDVSLVVRRKLPMGLACPIATRDADALLDRGGRHLFLLPWRDHTLVGVWHAVYEGTPDSFDVTPEELRRFLDEVNAAYPGFDLTVDDVARVNSGLILFGEGAQSEEKHSFGSRSVLIDHSSEGGLAGLVTLVGVRATTARGMASRAVDVIFEKLGTRPPRGETTTTPIHGGDFASMSDLKSAAARALDEATDASWLDALCRNHGSEYGKVVQYLRDGTTTDPITAEVINAVRNEMAVTLDDIIFRRTDLGTATPPDDETTRRCADVAARELGWSASRLEGELHRTRRSLSRGGANKDFTNASLHGAVNATV